MILRGMNFSEKELHKAVCNYIRLQYNGTLFNSDLAGSMKLTMGQAAQLKPLRSNRGFPDIAIYEPRQSLKNGSYHGLFIELKKEGERLYKKDGTPATDHIAEQLDCLLHLRKRGYAAAFAIGFMAAKQIIDSYMKGEL